MAFLSVGSPVPRPEYPRPERQRGHHEGVDWLNLNGPWQFRFDPQRRGVVDGWAKAAGPTWREQIIVPFCWESLAAWGESESAGNDHYYATRVFVTPSEVTAANHRSAPRYEVGWYRREVLIPSGTAWLGKRVILTVGAADFFTECWCNDVYLGRREGGYLPLEFDLTDALEPAADEKLRRASIVLRVEDPMDNRQQPVGKQWGWYTPTSGIWQTVFIEPRSAQYIREFRIYPNVALGNVRFEVSCERSDAPSKIEIEIRPPDAISPPIILVITERDGVGSVNLQPKSLWSPDKPQLYRITLKLCRRDGAVLDEVQSYFGLRHLSASTAPSAHEPGILCLNDQPVFIRGALYQSYHPGGVYTALDAATLRDDILASRRAGFDLLRIHLKLDDPLLLFYADTLGMLVMQDFPNFGEGGDTPLGRQRFETMMRAGMARDFNHPSIVAWCIFNETWGFGGQTELIKWITPQMAGDPAKPEAGKIANQASFQWVHEMWLLAKKLDPTRLIEDMSVVKWDHLAAYGHAETDINSWHFYLHDYALAKAHIAEVVAQTYPGSGFNYIEGFAQRAAPLINSEYGGVGALDGDRDVSWSFKFLTNELRRHPQLCAYIFTELTDVEWERNGFLNYDRTPKEFGYDPCMVNAADVLPLDAPPISQVAPGATIELNVQSSHYSPTRFENVALHWNYSGIDSLGNHYPRLAHGSEPMAFLPYQVGTNRIHVTAPSETMLCTLAVSAIASGGIVAAHNFVEHFVCGESPRAREARQAAIVLRRRVDEWDAASWTGLMSTPGEAKKEGACFGEGAGFFEWVFSDPMLRSLGGARRLRLILEISSRRAGIAQTSGQRHPSHYDLSLNGIVVHQGILPDHPHDSRGALSYLRGGNGAYGYLINTVLEAQSLAQIAASVPREGTLRFRCAVSQPPLGGVTVYDQDSGRLPIGPTLIIDWMQS